MRRSNGLLVLLFFVFHASYSQVSIPASTIVTETFNSIGTGASASLPSNWKMSSAATGSTSGYATGTNVTATTLAANSGLPSTGGRYNWASAAGTDRAIGFLTDGAYNSPNSIMVHYRNTTGATVNTITIAFSIERYVINTGSFSLSFAYSSNGSAWTSQSDGDIAAGEFPTGAAAGTFTNPKTLSKTVAISPAGGVPNNGDIYFRWVFNTTNAGSQGVGLDNVSVFAGDPTPVLTATLRDILQADNSIPHQFNSGDVIRYQAVIKNTGTGDANNLQITLPTPPPNTTMVAGSVKTSAVAIDDSYAASFNTTLNGSSVLANDAGIPAPTAVLSFGTTADATVNAGGATGSTDAGGSITLLANGTFTYTPLAGFSGTDRFKYITGNGNLPNNDAIVTITVAADITFTTTNVDPSCNGGSNGSIAFNASGGNGTLTYSVTGAAGTFQASNTFTGLPAGTYNLAVKDAGGYIKTSTTALNNPAAIAVSGTIPALTYNTAMAAASFTKTGGTGAITWSATGLPNGVTINATTGQVTGSPAQTGGFNAVITATDANACTGTRNVSFNVAPKLTNESYASVVGNTQLVADAHSAPATPFTTSGVNILSNDESDAAITITAVTNAATTAGGTITINAAGKFTYTPAAGYTGADSYTYTGTSNGVSATAVINLTVSNMVWYVNNTYAGANGAADGRSHRPFTTTTAAATASLANQLIYVHTGSGNTTGNTALKLGQTLRGAGSALSVGALSLAAGTKPTLSGTITLAGSVTLDGFDMSTGTATAITNAGTTVTGVSVNIGNVSTTTGTGISITGTGNSVSMTLASLTSNGAANAVTITNTEGSVVINGGLQTASTAASFNITGGTVALTYTGGITQTANAPMVSINGGHATGTVNFNTGTLNATNGSGLQFDNADGTYNFNGTNTLNGGDAGIDIINGSAGVFSFSSNSSITNPSGIGFNVNGGNGNITYPGTISKTSTGRLIEIQNRTGATAAFSGALTASASCTGVNLAVNTGATLNFTGGITFDGAAAVFLASGGGTLNITGTNILGNVTAATGPALSIVNTTIGGSGVTFRKINVTGGAKGVVVNNTGAGAFTITGVDGADADALADAGSGGTIQNTTARGVECATVGGAISLNGMNFTNATTTQTVDGTGCGSNLFTVDNTSCNAPIYLASTTGSVALNSIVVNGSVQIGINGSNVHNLTMNTVEVRNAGDDPNEHGILFRNLLGTGSATNINSHNNTGKLFYVHNNSGTLSSFSITNSTFANTDAPNGAQGILFVGNALGTTVNATVSNCTFSNLFSYAYQIAGNNSAVMNVGISNCNFSNVGSWTVVQASLGSNITSSITNNSGVAGPKSQAGPINLKVDNGGQVVPGSVLNATVSGNIIGNGSAGSGTDLTCGNCPGINANLRTGGLMNVTITGNLIQNITGYGIYVQGGEDLPSDKGKVNAVITGNLIRNPNGSTTQGIAVLSGVVSADQTCVTATIGGTVNPGSWPSTAANAMNRIEGDWATGTTGYEIYLWERFTNTIFNIPGLSGAPIPWIQARNSITSATNPVNAVGTFTANNACN